MVSLVRRLFQNEHPSNRKDFGAMPRWILTCKRCGEAIPYCEIGGSLIEFLFPKKPEIPPEGVEGACPVCQAKLIYQRYELTFRS